MSISKNGHDVFRDFFNDVKPIRLREPLAEALGAFKEKDAVVEYSFSDTVKMAGHACPTVASAYIACNKALEKLYPDSVPVRGDVSITVYGEPDETVYGVMSQVFSFITGAAWITGFRGLGHKFRRKDLLRFSTEKAKEEAMRFKFERTDNNKSVEVRLYHDKIPFSHEKAERLGELLEKVLWDAAKESEVKEFQNLWMEKVKAITDEKEINNWLKISD